QNDGLSGLDTHCSSHQCK
ncbi:hypothetical protein D038_4147B, partial [Vibrio parahaemolyticus IDH02189]